MRELQAAGSIRHIKGIAESLLVDGPTLHGVRIKGSDGAAHELHAEQILVFFGLHPKLGPIAEWGLALERKALSVDTQKFQTSVPGIFAVGDINTFPGKKKLILSGFHEAALAALAFSITCFRSRNSSCSTRPPVPSCTNASACRISDKIPPRSDNTRQQFVSLKELPMIRRHCVLAALALAAVSLAGGTHAAFAADKVCKLPDFRQRRHAVRQEGTRRGRRLHQVELTLTHTGKLPAAAMGHNWVLVKTADVSSVANAGMSAGLANSYLTPGDAHVIAATKIVGGGGAHGQFPNVQTTKGGDYTFMCTFPGHYVIMKGVFKFG